MFDKFNGIKISGEKFNNETSFCFFKENKQNVIVIYGKNGSGKTTIAKAISLLANNKNEDVDEEIKCNVIDGNGLIIRLSDAEKKNIFVFGENYISNNIKLYDDGLETIVLIGADKNNYEKIVENKKYVESFNNAIEKINVEKFKNDKIDSLTKEIKDILKSDDGWAERDKIIKGNTVKTGVTDEVIKNISLNNVNEKDINKLKIEFNEKIKTYMLIKNQPNIDFNFKIDLFSEYNDDNIVKLLNSKIERNEINDRDNEIINIIANMNSNKREELTNIMESNLTKCPYCLQEITYEYRENIKKIIKATFSNKVNNQINLIKNSKIKKIDLSFNIELFNQYPEIISKILSIKEEINKKIDEYDELLEVKLNNLYNSDNISSKNLGNSIKELNEYLKELELIRSKICDAKRKGEKCKEDLQKLNEQIAFLEIKSLLSEYKENEKIYNNKKRCIENYKKRIEDLVDKNAHLESLMYNNNEAVDIINDSLKMIFCSVNRLQIKYNSKKYIVMVNNKNVLLKNLSTGERNAIALAYFFIDIYRNKKSDIRYSNAEFIVLDDPISSLDRDNEIGLISFLQQQFDKIFNGNEKSKVLVLTHSLQVVEDLKKVMKSLDKNNKLDKQIFQISENGLLEFNTEFLYTEILQSIYNFIVSQDNTMGLYIGNSIRRLLEMFSTFNYRIGIFDLFKDENILSVFDDK